MTLSSSDLRGSEFDHADLTGARFRKVMLTGAFFRMADLSGAVMRDISLSGAAIDGADLDGLTINGVEVAPLVEAELNRRDPGRALRRAADPAGLRAAWAAIQQSWAELYERVAAMPAGTTDISVAEEWSLSQTLRHLVFATDAWLGAVLGRRRPFHPWGIPFSDLADFVDDLSVIAIDPAAAPSFDEVLELRANRVAMVQEFLAGVSVERLAEDCDGPLWERDRLTVIRCLWVILSEECEHLRFARRDLDLIDAGSPLVSTAPPVRR